MPGIVQDVFYALRLIRKSPAFTLIVVSTLALTVSLSTVVFSVLDAVFLRPLPYKNPDRIVSLTTYSPQNYTQPASYPEFKDWRQRSAAFMNLAAYNQWASVNFESPSGAVALQSVMTSDNFFQVFGVKPVLGRVFELGEEEPGRNRVVVLSNEVWRNTFGSSPNAIGAKVKLDGSLHTVIGVMPAGFRFPISKSDAIYRPLDMTPNQRNGRGSHWLPAVARLQPSTGPKAAEQEFNAVLKQLGREHRDTEGRRAKVVDLETFTVGASSRNALHLLAYAVLALVAIGCVNIAGLFFARSTRLEREAAVRSVLGASRARLTRQFVTEALLYALAGAVSGVAIAYVLLHLISVLLIASLSRGSEVEVNVPVLMTSLALSIVTGLLAAILPAWRLSGSSTNLALRSGGRTGADRKQRQLRAGFVITQIALALVLLVIAGFLFRTLSGLRHTEFGFSPDHILTAEIDLSPGTYEQRDVLTTFYTPLLERVRSMPGVESAGLIQVVPIQSWGWNSDVHIAGQPPNRPNEERLAEIRLVTPGYYSVFHDRLVSGRLPDEKIDGPKSQRVAVVNDEFVRRFIPKNENPLGKVIDSDDKVTIVGVVRNLRQDIYQKPLAEVDWPISQIPADMRIMVLPSMHLLVRTVNSPESVIGSLRQIFHQVDPTLPFRQPVSMKTVISEGLTFERLENWLFGTFAALAVLLALLGVYGLISQEVELSRRDIGVRMALGATRSKILKMMYRRVGKMLTLGIAIGLFVIWAARKLIQQVTTIEFARDGTALIGLIAVFALIALLASSIPARRAASIHPMESLRSE